MSENSAENNKIENPDKTIKNKQQDGPDKVDPGTDVSQIKDNINKSDNATDIDNTSTPKRIETPATIPYDNKSPVKDTISIEEKPLDTKSTSANEEIEKANKKNAEDIHIAERHQTPFKDYQSMPMDELVIEIESLLKNQKIQSIRNHVAQIKIAFDNKFNEVIEDKKEEFVEEGGNIIDFHYSSPVKTKFNRIYFEYREKRDNHYKKLKKNLNENLKNRLSLIEELKNMIGSGRDMKANFNQFKELQEKWRNAGPVPSVDYSELWKTYHHHVERFYDFLHLDREFRDKDFQYNLDQKLKIIERAEELLQEEDINRVFRELQLLHKIWKEELGPVAKEYRDSIWDKFSAVTKKIHDKRKIYFEKLDEEKEKNIIVKQDIVRQIEKIATTTIKTHKQAQNNMKLINELRDLFYKSGKVPQKDNEAIWNAFKENTRHFNKSKNAFYKTLKNQQNDNLHKKLDLIKIAEDNKDSDDFETVTPIMKNIQKQWKTIGFVPRKHSDKIWKQFKEACNHYFDRLHTNKNIENKEELLAYTTKKNLLDNLTKFNLTGHKEDDLNTIKTYLKQWSTSGTVPRDKRYMEGKLMKALDQVFQKMKLDKKQAEMLKYDSRLQSLEDAKNQNLVHKEEQFLKNKINDTQAKINQFENNLQFFSTTDKESPLVKEVFDNIDLLKKELDIWKTKLIKIKSLQI